MADTKFLFYVLDPDIDSEETILNIRNNAIELLSQLKTTTEWQGEGVSTKKEIVMQCEKCIAMCTRTLKLQNPRKYGRISRQSGVFRTR